jgi:hypothetical protein
MLRVCRAASSEQSWCRGMRWVREKIFAMIRVPTPLLSLGPAKLAGVICSVSHDSPLHQEVSLIDTCLSGRRGKIWVTSMRPWRHTALPQRGAGKFFIALTIVLDGFQGWWFGPWHAQEFSTVVPISVPGIGCPGSRSSGCAGCRRAARATGSGG